MYSYTGLVGTSYRELSHMVSDKKLGREGTARVLTEALRRKDIKPADFRLRPLFEALVPQGKEFLLQYATGGFSENTARLLESGEVKSSQFSNITGQIVYSETLKYYEDEDFVFSKEVPETTSPFLDAEKVAGIGRIGDEVEVVGEAQPYPYVGPVEDYIHLPPAKKRGDIVALTWEAVFSDRTGDLLSRAGEVGHWLGLNKEKRIIDCMVDENGGAVSAMVGGHRYHWRGTSYATYQTSTPWDNVTTSNALVDWTDIENAELTLSRITDPNTGEPIMVQPDVVVVTKQLEYTARYILQATSLAVNAGGYATSGTPTRFEMPNFLPKYKILTSRLLETRMATDTDWYLGNLKRAIGYKVCRPLTVEQAPAGHPDEFNRDVVNQWKASEIGAAFTRDPRFLNESRA
ncbi:MAG TPA: hypothetical protein VEA69_13340 [Tepidisphaeraceae bacterium]|nr:hypothetical protein [Tepidisphaeraceae bacterium]